MPPTSSTRPAQSPERRPPVEPLTYEQFLDWADEDTYAEWVNGRVVFMSPVSREHSNLSSFLFKIVVAFVEEHDLGEVHTEPFQMKTGPELPGRSPDIFYVAKENAARFKRHYLDGPADLVVEIVSPDSRSRDRGEKFYEYEEGGVKEYWLIDLPRQRAEFFQIGVDGRYKSAAALSDGRFDSVVLAGFWLKVDWLWQQPPPSLRQVQEEWSAKR
jgi:Uma2 family endonuclease